MNISELLESAEVVWNTMSEEQTQETAKEILEISENLKEKVQKMFHIGQEAAEDVTAIITLSVNAAEHIHDAAFTRGFEKPPAEVASLQDAVINTVRTYHLYTDES